MNRTDMSYEEILSNLAQTNTKLIAVSKTKPDEAILKLYEKGQRDFGENKVQEMLGKYERLPKDIRWHLIGHLQSNKVKYIAPFVHMIHSVDSLKLCKEIQKQAVKADREISILLQIKVAQEESKYGLPKEGIDDFLDAYYHANWSNVTISGLMGMATFTNDQKQIETEFKYLKDVFDSLKASRFESAENFSELSMGMSADYPIACKHGSTMVRIGSLLFGARVYME